MGMQNFKRISADERLPDPLQNVLVEIEGNTAKGMNFMVAHYIPKYYEECIECDEWRDYSEEDDMYFVPEGWYANTTYIGDEYSSYFINEKVINWMSLPKGAEQ